MSALAGVLHYWLGLNIRVGIIHLLAVVGDCTGTRTENDIRCVDTNGTHTSVGHPPPPPHHTTRDYTDYDAILHVDNTHTKHGLIQVPQCYDRTTWRIKVASVQYKIAKARATPTNGRPKNMLYRP